MEDFLMRNHIFLKAGALFFVLITLFQIFLYHRRVKKRIPLQELKPLMMVDKACFVAGIIFFVWDWVDKFTSFHKNPHTFFWDIPITMLSILLIYFSVLQWILIKRYIKKYNPE